MELKGPKVTLRELRHVDAEALLELRICNRTFFEKTLPKLPDHSLTLEYIGQENEKNGRRREDGSSYRFGVFENASGDLVGECELSKREGISDPRLGPHYAIGEQYGGKGYGTEAVKLLLQYGFGELRLDLVRTGALPDNKASVRILKKCGFREDGTWGMLEIECLPREHTAYALSARTWRRQFLLRWARCNARRLARAMRTLAGRKEQSTA
jgi:ribosomal-protein-alanine N-acetyltransferase